MGHWSRRIGGGILLAPENIAFGDISLTSGLESHEKISPPVRHYHHSVGVYRGSNRTPHSLVVWINSARGPHKLSAPGIVSRDMIRAEANDRFHAVDFHDMWSGVTVTRLLLGFDITIRFPGNVATLKINRNKVGIPLGLHHRDHGITCCENG